MSLRERVSEHPISGESKRGFVFTRPRLTLAALAVVLAFVLSACGSGDASTPATAGATDGPTVTIEDLAFAPEAVTVEAGDTVIWKWKDGAIAHDVAGDGFQSEVMSEGTFRHRFDEPGNHDYVCTLHPNMTGTIEVRG